MILGLTWLIAFQLLGVVTVRLLDLDVPGPVAGMLHLFVFRTAISLLLPLLALWLF